MGRSLHAESLLRASPRGERQTVVPQSTQVLRLTGWRHEHHSTCFTTRLCRPVSPCSSAVVSGTHDLLLAKSHEVMRRRHRPSAARRV